MGGVAVAAIAAGIVAVALLLLSPWLGWRPPVVGAFVLVLFFAALAVVAVPTGARLVLLPFAAAFVALLVPVFEHWNEVRAARARLQALRAQRESLSEPADAPTASRAPFEGTGLSS
ncbi:hypothetical protein AB1399_13605 [Hydrogenibacillus schlegelii]|uniref:Uncharacterized protein n=1 Tax=Hydrogenibacillus schlegelii TaxID=1484 RepID=A0A132N842_HYDSH|nr:hypothetical protein [Hydrogenibacillus schlegelii]KWX06137.1 hypothetical protein TR75_06930 [Hydrogenibacillus schlegelii]OAR04242.1 hypothetical protein SA87_07280 [Hydrogenibacillus schlegelii]